MTDLPVDHQHHHSPSTYFVYIVQCADGTLYTGYTTNVDQRVASHNAGKGAKYTRAHRPVSLVACWPFTSKSEALRAEWAIKRLPRARKLSLIAQSSSPKTPLPEG